MHHKELIYLATPYSHPDDQVRHDRFRLAAKLGAAMMKKGMIVYSPISHTHPMAEEGSLPTDWKYWAEVDTAFLTRCTKLVVATMDGWDKSKGVYAEIQIAQALNLPIEYKTPSEILGEQEEPKLF